MRRPFGLIVPLLATCAVVPVGLLIAIGDRHVMPPMWVHFYGVGVSALVATAAAVVLTTVGAREGDARTVIVGGGFALMAALLAVHGLVTPGVLVGMNGLISVTGAATLPVGAAVMTLSALPAFTGRYAIPRVLVVEAVLGAALVGGDRPLRGRPRPVRSARRTGYEHIPVDAARRRLRGRARHRAARVGALWGADSHVHGSRLVARPHLRDARNRRRRGVARLRPPARPAFAHSGRRPARGGPRRGGRSIPRCTCAGVDGESRREGHIDGRAHAARRDACRRARRAARPLPRAPAQPRNRRASARHRQALRARVDPQQARLARRRRVWGDQAAPGARARALERARRLRRGSRAE